MSEQTLEASWNAFCAANGFERFDLVPKAYKGQKALYLELQRDRLDAVIKHPAHPLAEFDLKLISDIEDHEVDALVVTMYLGRKDSTPVDKVAGKGF